jgi:carboxyl-terminal processing protease
MERWQKLAVAVICVIAMALATFAAGFALGDDTDRSPISLLGGGRETSATDTIGRAIEEIQASSVDPLGERALARAAIRGIVRALKRADDPYASFYSPTGYKAFQQYTRGHFSGIGVWLKKRHQELEIISVLPGTPAVDAGLSRGDVISRVDGVAVDSLSVDDAVARIKGPAGSRVTLEIRRTGEVLERTLTRRSIDLPNVVARLNGGDIGYIRLFGFARGAGSQVRARVHDLTEEGAEGLVLDLRDNGGGLFSEAIDVASVFIEDGDIVTYRESSEPDRVYEAEGEAFNQVPLVVLVNEGTASASEIVAGALQDRDRAILVGDRTYGKGSVQEVFALPDASAIKLTTGAYLTPGGHDITGKGIEPDVKVVGTPKQQRARAIDILRGIVLSTTGAQG